METPAAMTDIMQIKHEVLSAVATYAFAGKLAEGTNEIPYELIPGIKPRFRCCVYREREIIRQRIRMAMGKLPQDVANTNEDPAQVVHVIPCACEGCPITQVTVTQNCQSCLAKKCVKACPFGAISSSPVGTFIDPDKCKKCGRCVAACPYHAIVEIERPCIKSCPVKAISMDANNIATITPEKCINCGACVGGCPFGAISDISMMANVIETLSAQGQPLVALVAPSVEGQFGKATLAQIKQAILQLGFAGVEEVALGADIVAAGEAEELSEKMQKGEVLTSSCCPAFVSLVGKHYPAVKGHVSTTVSPMVAAERHYRGVYGGNASFVFIGPCIAKKNEVLSRYIHEIEYVLTFEELYAMFTAKEIDPNQPGFAETQATLYGRGFALAGGVTGAVLQATSELGSPAGEVTAQKCSGAEECKTALALLKAGRLKANFIEGMACVGGCMGGPATLEELQKSKKVFEAHTAENPTGPILNNLKARGAAPLQAH